MKILEHPEPEIGMNKILLPRGNMIDLLSQKSSVNVKPGLMGFLQLDSIGLSLIFSVGASCAKPVKTKTRNNVDCILFILVFVSALTSMTISGLDLVCCRLGLS